MKTYQMKNNINSYTFIPKKETFEEIFGFVEYLKSKCKNYIKVKSWTLAELVVIIN